MASMSDTYAIPCPAPARPFAYAILVLVIGCGRPALPPFLPPVPSPNLVLNEGAADTMLVGDPRMVLYCGPSHFLDEPVTSVRFSAQVRLAGGNGRLRAFLFIHSPQAMFPRMIEGRIVRPGELPPFEWVPLVLEVPLGNHMPKPEDRLELVLANEGANELHMRHMRITSVTRDVPGRPATSLHTQ